MGDCYKNVVTVFSGGRTGNLIFEYASVWGLSKKFGLKPYVPDEIRNELDKIFVNLDVPRLSNIQNPVDYDYLGNLISDKKLEVVVEEAKNSNQPVVLRQWIQLYEVILPYVNELKQNFVFKREIVAKVQKKFQSIQSSMHFDEPRQQILFVGVHIRRTDYPLYLTRFGITVPVNVGYYRRAVAWMDSILREQHSNHNIGIAYVVTSDDRYWCEERLIPEVQNDLKNCNLIGKSDIFYAGSPNDVFFDLALLSSCNHSIISYGTFGIWSALMAGGWTVYYDVSVFNKGDKARTSTMTVAETLHNWRPLV